MCKSSDGCGSRQARRYETTAHDSRLVGDGDGVPGKKINSLSVWKTDSLSGNSRVGSNDHVARGNVDGDESAMLPANTRPRAVAVRAHPQRR